MTTAQVSIQSKLLVAIEALLVATTLLSGYVAVRRGSIAARRHIEGGELETTLAGLSTDLATRYREARTYDPDGLGLRAGWAGISAPFPPGPAMDWEAGGMWARFAHRPSGAIPTRYAVLTAGKEAWVLAYGDPDRNGEPRKVFRRFVGGALAAEWRFGDDE